MLTTASLLLWTKVKKKIFIIFWMSWELIWKKRDLLKKLLMIFLLKMPKLFVLDTNSLLSAFLIERSVSTTVLNRCRKVGKIAMSEETFSGFSLERRTNISYRLKRNAVMIKWTIHIQACRDSKDNKFLELTVAAKTSCITGDKDLLVLHPFKNIPILTAAEFLKHFWKNFRVIAAE